MRARLAVVVIVLSCVFLTAQTGRTWSAFSAVTSNPSSLFASAASFGSCGYTPAAIDRMLRQLRTKNSSRCKRCFSPQVASSTPQRLP